MTASLKIISLKGRIYKVPSEKRLGGSQWTLGYWFSILYTIKVPPDSLVTGWLSWKQCMVCWVYTMSAIKLAYIWLVVLRNGGANFHHCLFIVLYSMVNINLFAFWLYEDSFSRHVFRSHTFSWWFLILSIMHHLMIMKRFLRHNNLIR